MRKQQKANNMDKKKKGNNAFLVLKMRFHKEMGAWGRWSLDASAIKKKFGVVGKGKLPFFPSAASKRVKKSPLSLYLAVRKVLAICSHLRVVFRSDWQGKRSDLRLFQWRMADVLSKSSVFSSCGRQFSICGSPGKAAGKICLAGFCSLRSSLPVRSLRSSFGSDFHGRKVVVWEERGKPTGALHTVPVQMSLCIGKAMKWWEKGLQPNMREIQSAQDLVDSLLNAGNKLVIVDFFSPGCGGCKALHPKICQFAEMNPEVLFLQINYEEHKSMCYSLNVHVLPFFRFYRGAQGRLCSFSCTNATIKKFKDALAKHNTDRCTLGPAKGLEESELMALAANKDLSFSYSKRPEPVAEPIQAPGPVPPVPKLPFSAAPKATQESEERAVVTAGR